ncbi:MAG: ParB/RepB/Spo0J family partition protein [Pikeienuella sp.]|uniref:ParB/RepB/Spo0J family partition protein n=1 Tax=Pikeienuella sp. TaxID=2831957 RepID=UPI003918E1C3
MSEMRKRRGLGRGLSSLLDGAGSDTTRQGGAQIAAIDLVRPNPNQPRKIFLPLEMEELAESIRRNGIIQPLIVRPRDEGGFEIVAGERRWRAAQSAGLHEVPVIVRELTDDEVLQLAIVENVQRADLNAIEEAQGYQSLIEVFGHNQAEVARAVGKSRPHVANMLRLLGLPEAVRDLVMDRRISAGHARALIGAADPSALAMKIVAEGLTVRQTEDLARRVPGPPKPRARGGAKDPDTVALENDLAAALALRVSIAHRGDGGEVRISYSSLDQLDGLCQLLMR